MKRTSIDWKSWIWILIILCVVLLLLNFVLPLKSPFHVIGDEKDWLVIWVNIVSPIIATVIGVKLQTSYNRREHIKEQNLRNLRAKIETSKESYSQLKKIVENNMSVFNFNEFRKLIQCIDCETINTGLIVKVLDYQTAISNVQNNMKSFFQNKEKSVEVVVYQEAVAQFVKLYNKILPEFIDYLNSIDNNFHNTMSKADILAPFVRNEDKLKITLMKMTGNKMMHKQKENLIDILNNQQSNIDKLTLLLNRASSRLLNNESKKIRKLESEIENIQ